MTITVLSELATGSQPADHVVVVAQGDIDLCTAGHLREQLGCAMGGRSTVVVLDTSAVTFIDCCGLRELVAARVRLVAGGRRLLLRSPSPAVLRLLAWTGTTSDFGVASAVAAAAAAA